MLRNLLGEHYWNNFEAELLDECRELSIDCFSICLGDAARPVDLKVVSALFFNEILLLREANTSWERLCMSRSEKFVTETKYPVQLLIETLESDMESVSRVLLKRLDKFPETFPETSLIHRETDLKLIYRKFKEECMKHSENWLTNEDFPRD